MSTKKVSAPAPNQQRMFAGLAVIVALAVVGAVVAVVLSSRPTATSDPERYSSIQQSRTEDGGFVLGNPDAPVTIVEFADFLCPHCQTYKATIGQFIDEYVVTGRAKFEYRLLPAVDPTFSVQAAQLAECANVLDPGSFWAAHDTLFELAASTRFNASTARAFAERMGLDYGELLSCTQSARQFEVDSELADAVGVQGTPAVMVRYGDGGLEWPEISSGRGGLEFAGLKFLVEAAPKS